MAAVVAMVWSGTKGAHLELKGQVIKARTGAIDDQHSIAVLDLRVENPSDLYFVVRMVKVTLEKADGTKVDGNLVSKIDIGRVFAYNKFLGLQYNDALSMHDEVKPHGRIDRMVAAGFDVPASELESGKSIDIWIQDMTGAEFDTVHKLK